MWSVWFGESLILIFCSYIVYTKYVTYLLGICLIMNLALHSLVWFWSMKMPFSRIFSRIVPAEGLKIRGAEGQSVMQGILMEKVLLLIRPKYGWGECPHAPLFPPALQDISRKWVQFFKALWHFRRLESHQKCHIPW